MSAISRYCSFPRAVIPTPDLLGLYSRAFQLYTSNFSIITKIALCTLIPATILTGLAALCLPGFQRVWSTLGNEFSHRNDKEFEPVKRVAYPAEFFFFCMIYYLGYLLYCFTVAAYLKVASDADAGTGAGMDTSLTSALDIAHRVFPRVFIAGCIVLDLSLLASFFLILPGLFLYLSWWLTFPAVVYENLGVFPAMKRSWSLSDGYRLDLAKIIFSCVAFHTLMIYVAYLLMGLTGCSHWIRLMVAYSLPPVCIQPAVCVLQSVVYFDLASRYEVTGPIDDSVETGSSSIETNPFVPLNTEEPLL